MEPLHYAQHGFRPTYSTQEVLYIIRSLIEKAREWRDHIFMLDGDIEKAYDNCEHKYVISGLLAKNAPVILLQPWQEAG